MNECLQMEWTNVCTACITFHLPAFLLSTSTTFIVENCSPHQIINPIKDKSTPQIYKYKCSLPFALTPSPLSFLMNISVCGERARQIKIEWMKASEWANRTGRARKKTPKCRKLPNDTPVFCMYYSAFGDTHSKNQCIENFVVFFLH